MSTPAIHNLPLRLDDDEFYGRRWVIDGNIALRSTTSPAFKHNPHHPFTVRVFEDRARFESWFGISGPNAAKVAPNGVGALAATPNVIQSRELQAAFPRPQTLLVAPGDILRTNVGDFMIRDDWALHDPYLVPVVVAEYEVRAVIDPAVWQLNYGLNDEKDIPGDVVDFLRQVLDESMKDFIDRTGNAGTVHVNPAV